MQIMVLLALGLGANWAAPQPFPAGGTRAPGRSMPLALLGTAPASPFQPLPCPNLGGEHDVTTSWRVDSELSSIHSPNIRAGNRERRGSPILKARAPLWVGAWEISSRLLDEGIILKV